MYCVIQEIRNKKANPYGAYKELEVRSTTWTISGITSVKYSYFYTGERFERPMKKSYKISIHKSYRENGKVKKKQYVICTMEHYDVLDMSPYDYILKDKIKTITKELEITEEEFWEIIYIKFEPLREKIESEFQQTEEFNTKQKHEEITTIHIARKLQFEEKYGKDTYDYCYDVFGVLRNEEYLNKLKADYEAQEEYQRRYQESYNSNYKYNSYSSYQEIKRSNYNEEEKKQLKEFYKTLAKKFHPDICKDDGEAMRLINKLKEEWECN